MPLILRNQGVGQVFPHCLRRKLFNYLAVAEIKCKALVQICMKSDANLIRFKLERALSFGQFSTQAQVNLNARVFMKAV